MSEPDTDSDLPVSSGESLEIPPAPVVAPALADGTAVAPVFRQMRLFAAENPMRHRFGRTFWQTVPHSPGVYYFRDAELKLLYVGQSHDLRKRVGSYRHVHPDRHPRRLVRLVHQVRHIEWEVCQDHDAAKAREKELLLELRPGFNRAGVWLPPPWWLEFRPAQGGLSLRLLAAVPASLQEGCHYLGPYPSSFRWVHAALGRCLHRWLHPHLSLSSWPQGWMGERVPLHLCWSSLPSGLPFPPDAAVLAFLSRQSDQLLEAFQQMVTEETPPLEKEFWLGQIEFLAKFATLPPSAPSSDSVAASPVIVPAPRPAAQRHPSLFGDD
ncbi:MAG: nucleotide excision repair endonuclease [Verrucomicrobium sp.]|nr:nucleotide excision repair endonuclease [Verrucomicrobium sp.]